MSGIEGTAVRRPDRVVACFGVVVLPLVMAACGDDPAGIVEDLTEPVFSVPIVELDRVVGITPFGATLSNGEPSPAWELITDGRDVQVRAVTAGQVRSISVNFEGDFEVHVQQSRTSIYTVIYDHIRDLNVSLDQELDAGDVLGRVGFTSAQRGRIGLQVNRRLLAVCPRDFGTPAFQQGHDAVLEGTGGNFASLCLVDVVNP